MTPETQEENRFLRWSFASLVFALLIVLELLGGNTGLPLPLLPGGMFYFALQQNKRCGILFAAGAAIATECIWERPLPLALPALAATLLLLPWLLKRRNAGFSPFPLAGAAIASLYALVFGILRFCLRPVDAGEQLLDLAAFVIGCALFGAAYFPVLCLVLDRIAYRLGLAQAIPEKPVRRIQIRRRRVR